MGSSASVVGRCCLCSGCGCGTPVLLMLLVICVHSLICSGEGHCHDVDMLCLAGGLVRLVHRSARKKGLLRDALCCDQEAHHDSCLLFHKYCGQAVVSRGV